MERLLPTLMWALLLIPSATLAQDIEPLSLKGFRLGQAMAQCPADSTAEEAGKDGSTLCNLGPTTLANHPATAHAVVLADGKVVGVMVSLPDRGPNASTQIRDALIEKFGQPTSRKSHLNEARWIRGNEALSFDGYRGAVILVDVVATRRRAASAAKANQKDL